MSDVEKNINATIEEIKYHFWEAFRLISENFNEVDSDASNTTSHENDATSYDDLSYHCRELVVNIGKILISGDVALYAFVAMYAIFSLLITVVIIVFLFYLAKSLFC